MLLSNINAAEGRWDDDVEKVREMMKENRVEKDVGLSLVGSSESDPRHVTEGGGCSVRRNGVMLSMLGEMGVCMKLASEES